MKCKQIDINDHNLLKKGDLDIDPSAKIPKIDCQTLLSKFNARHSEIQDKRNQIRLKKKRDAEEKLRREKEKGGMNRIDSTDLKILELEESLHKADNISENPSQNSLKDLKTCVDYLKDNHTTYEEAQKELDKDLDLDILQLTTRIRNE